MYQSKHIFFIAISIVSKCVCFILICLCCLAVVDFAPDSPLLLRFLLRKSLLSVCLCLCRSSHRLTHQSWALQLPVSPLSAVITNIWIDLRLSLSSASPAPPSLAFVIHTLSRRAFVHRQSCQLKLFLPFSSSSLSAWRACCLIFSSFSSSHPMQVCLMIAAISCFNPLMKLLRR